MSKKSEAVKRWRENTKKRIVEAMGGKCQICGYLRCYRVLELHHLDPTKKELSFGAIRATPRSWALIVVELRKCILLCSNCHVEVHANITEIPKKFTKFNENFAVYKDINNHIHGN